MPTTTVKSIGTSSRDYSTVQAWEDACPSNLVTADEIWKGECYADSEFLVTSSNLLTASGVTTDNTRYLWLTAAAGESFADLADPDTDTLRYDSTRGVAMRITGVYTQGFDLQASKTLVERIQFKADRTDSNSFFCIKAGYWRGCLLENMKQGGSWDPQSSPTYINCLIVFRGSSSASNIGTGTTKSYNNTVVRPSDLTTGGTAFNAYYGYYPTVKNTAVFGAWSTIFGGTIGSYPAGGYNASSVSNTPGTPDQASKVFGDQFENTSNSTRDWRVKSTADLVGNGTPDVGTEGDLSTIRTNGIDILGRTRDSSAPTIGCFEYIASGGTSDGVGSLSATGTLAGVGASNRAGVGSLSATGTLAGVGASNRAGVGSLSATGTISAVGADAGGGVISGVGSLAATGTLAGVGASTFAGVGSLSATGTLAGVGASNRAGVGALSGTGTIVAVGANASSGGAGILLATGTIVGVGASTRAGVGTLNATFTLLGTDVEPSVALVSKKFGFYIPDPVLLSPDPTVQYLIRELQKIQTQFQIGIAQTVVFHTSEPSRPYEGLLVGADGTEWNPGSGRGIYARVNSAWVKLG